MHGHSPLLLLLIDFPTFSDELISFPPVQLAA